MNLTFITLRNEIWLPDAELILDTVKRGLWRRHVETGHGDDNVPGVGFKFEFVDLRFGISNNVEEDRALTWNDATTVCVGLLRFLQEPPPWPGSVEVSFIIERDSKGRLGRGVLVREENSNGDSVSQGGGGMGLAVTETSKF